MSASSARRTARELTTPGLPHTQSPTERILSTGLSGLRYVPLSPGRVRLAASTGALTSPAQVSQPRFPRRSLLRMSVASAPTLAFKTVARLVPIGITAHVVGDEARCRGPIAGAAKTATTVASATVETTPPTTPA